MSRAFVREERGYAMAALLVAMSVMAIVLSTAMPVYQTVARREREAELVFRGEQYARAIALFQRKYANALPPDVDALINERFLRKKYKDPITGEDFRFLGPGSPELAEALSTTPQQAVDAARAAGALQAQRGRGADRGASTSPFTGGRQQQGGRQASPAGFAGRGARGMQTGRGAQPFGAQAFGAQAGRAQSGGGILAVSSTSSETSFRVYNGKNKYNEWIFMALSATTAAGAPPGSGGQAPGGRGGVAPGGRGTPAPGGVRGRGGFTPRGGR